MALFKAAGHSQDMQSTSLRTKWNIHHHIIPTADLNKQVSDLDTVMPESKSQILLCQLENNPSSLTLANGLLRTNDTIALIISTGVSDSFACHDHRLLKWCWNQPHSVLKISSAELSKPCRKNVISCWPSLVVILKEYRMNSTEGILSFIVCLIFGGCLTNTNDHEINSSWCQLWLTAAPLTHSGACFHQQLLVVSGPT